MPIAKARGFTALKIKALSVHVKFLHNSFIRHPSGAEFRKYALLFLGPRGPFVYTDLVIPCQKGEVNDNHPFFTGFLGCTLPFVVPRTAIPFALPFFLSLSRICIVAIYNFTLPPEDSCCFLPMCSFHNSNSLSFETHTATPC